MRRTASVWLAVATAIPLGVLDAQKAMPPDSVLVNLLSPALVRLLDYEIASAARGRAHVLKLALPSSSAWARISAHLLRSANGRAPTAHDSLYTKLSIRDIHYAADTLVVTFVKESLDRCPKDRWVSTGTNYQLKLLAYRGYWTERSFEPGLTWDAFGCPTPNVESNPTGAARL